MTLTPREKQIKDRLQAEVRNREDFFDHDAEFKRMVEEEDELSFFQSNYDFDAKGNFMKGIDGYSLHEKADTDLEEGPQKEYVRIIGKTNPKTVFMFDDDKGKQREPSIQEKITRQLIYLKKTMDLDEAGMKHWFYRLRREYMKEAKIKARLERRKAKKQFRKTMKKYRIQEVLDQEENFERFYDDVKNKRVDPKLKEHSEDNLPTGYENMDELAFYGMDVDFMRFHKRTKKNMHHSLQEILDSSKQTMQAGLKQLNNVTVNHIELNKACSLIKAFWTLN
mmetsp:Transcript_22666/g.34964  ORF Transcript_22666/g.34964 Transcript_22666/m.34964 type:complete len:280 (-) Transcript_22666:109-948(-)